MEFDKNLIKELQQARISGDLEKEKALVQHLRLPQIKELYSKAFGNFLGQNYDLINPKTGKIVPNKILNLFEDQDKINDLKFITDKEGYKDFSKNNKNAIGIYKNNTIGIQPGLDLETELSLYPHEIGHKIDEINFPKEFEEGVTSDKMRKNLKGTARIANARGLDEAENILEGHHSTPEFYERYGLGQLAKNKKLSTSLAALGKLGTGAGIASALYSAKSQADEGDYGEATKTLADQGSYFVPYVGEARMALDAGKALWDIPYGIYNKMTENPSVFEDEFRKSESEGGELPQDIQEKQDKFNKTLKLLQNNLNSYKKE